MAPGKPIAKATNLNCSLGLTLLLPGPSPGLNTVAGGTAVSVAGGTSMVLVAGGGLVFVGVRFVVALHEASIAAVTVTAR